MEIESALSALNKGERFESPELQILLSVLESLSLIDYEKTEIDYRYRNDESRDIATSLKRSVAQESFLARIKIESDGITRIGNVRDGGTRKILERREFAIQIRGSGRIAYSLLGTLIASGFDLCKIYNNREISSRDLIGGCVSKRDIGMAAEIKADELLHEASLYPEPLEIPKEVDLIVSIGPPLPELLQEWNREQIPQLFVDFDNPGEIRIGPYVTPGIGACYNCLNIGEIERGQPVLNALKNSLEKSIHGSQELDVTAALASFTAGIVALTIAEIADTGRSALHEKSALFSMLDFLEPQITSWERSPRCGCNWI